MLRPRHAPVQIPNHQLQHQCLHMHQCCPCRAPSLFPLQGVCRRLTTHAHPRMLLLSILTYLQARFPLQLVIWPGSVMHMPVDSRLCSSVQAHHPTYLPPTHSQQHSQLLVTGEKYSQKCDRGPSRSGCISCACFPTAKSTSKRTTHHKPRYLPRQKT
ncbi:hypothetical protein EDB19DRAFT_1711003 [Suillus lakei]|nr:hypothetical protein EDB19DRAFT_1711003 [Suillus lakei]